MRLTRVFVSGGSLRAHSRVTLPESAARHLIRVLRLKSGAALVLFDGSGERFDAVLGSNDGARLSVEVGESLGTDTPPRVPITLVQAVARADSMDLIVQKATELGVQQIVPVITQRSVVRLDEERGKKRRRHWQAVAVSACEQCGRNLLPKIEAPRSLDAYLDNAESGLRVVFDQTTETPLNELPVPSDALTLLVGPEGGLTAEEVEAASRKGFGRASLGPRILRAETAAIAAVTLAQSLWGDM